MYARMNIVTLHHHSKRIMGCLEDPEIVQVAIKVVILQGLLIGASLSEPHINGTAMREFCIIYYYYGASVTRNIMCPAWFYGHKREIFYCAFSCLGYRPYIRRSNLANC